jgi:hypothetical protein
VSDIVMLFAEILVMRWFDITMVPIFRLRSCQRIQNFIYFAEDSYGIISSGTYYITLA